MEEQYEPLLDNNWGLNGFNLDPYRSVVSNAFYISSFFIGDNTMAVQMKIKIVNTLPVTYTASTLYMVKGAEAGLFDLYMSTNDGAAVRHIISKTEINTMIMNALAGFNTVQVVADITARNALSPTVNTQVMVLDATGDTTVAAGAATYVYDVATTTWYKISETESMDVVLAWANITGKPTSAVADIDDAVAKRHSHANKAILDNIGDTDGFLTYSGTIVGLVAMVAEW